MHRIKASTLLFGLVLAGVIDTTRASRASDVINSLLRLHHSKECRGCDLSRADLANSDFSDADLTGANLSDANLSGSRLNGANLSSANLSRANLSHASLASARLTGAQLYMTDLRNAIVTGAEVSIEQLSKADIADAIGIESVYRDLNDFMTAGESAIKNGKYQLAERLFSHVLEADRKSYKALIGRSASRLAMGRIDLAISDLEQSHELAIEQGLERETVETRIAKDKLIAFEKAHNEKGKRNYNNSNPRSNQDGNIAESIGSGIVAAAKIGLPIIMKILTSGAL